MYENVYVLEGKRASKRATLEISQIGNSNPPKHNLHMAVLIPCAYFCREEI